MSGRGIRLDQWAGLSKEANLRAIKSASTVTLVPSLMTQGLLPAQGKMRTSLTFPSPAYWGKRTEDQKRTKVR